MDDLRCPFSAPVLAGTFHCHGAEQVIRRGGYEIACQEPEANQLCQNYFQCLKNELLDKMGHEDDLESVPHSVLQKIQYGGLQFLIQNENDADVAKLIANADTQTRHFTDMQYDRILEAVESVQLKKRRR